MVEKYGDFVKVSLFELISWKLTNELVVYDGSPVKGAESILWTWISSILHLLVDELKV